MNVITFEQPLNELTRTNLRLELLFDKLHNSQNNDPHWHVRNALSTIAEIINTVDRHDLKTKYTKALQDKISFLTPFTQQSGIDHQALGETIGQLKNLFHYFSHANGRLLQTIRDHYFIASIAQHASKPCGLISFELPELHYWLHMHDQEKQSLIKHWLQELEPLEKAVALMLQLIRDRKKNKFLVASNGFHQATLSSNPKAQLIQVTVEKTQNVYAVISANQLRLNIRFYEGSHLSSEEQAQRDVAFELICCY